MKKGGEALTFVFSLVFLALILTFYFFIFSTVATRTVEFRLVSLNSVSDGVNSLNYLKTPTGKNNFTIADLIIYSYYNKDNKDLEKLTKDIFNKVYSEEKCPIWILNAKVKDDEFFDVDSDFSLEQLRGGLSPRFNLKLFGLEPLRYSSSQIIIPSFNENIKVDLIAGCKR